MENITKDQVLAIWREVFPNSAMLTSKAFYNKENIFYSGKLANDKSELSNGYWENDMLNYHFDIENNIYSESALSIHIKPDNQYLCYSTAKIRKKTIKNLTSEKLKARFLQVKQLIVDNKENFINLQFDINNKI